MLQLRLLLVILCTSALATSQRVFEGAFLPSLNITTTTAHNFKLNFRLENRQFFYESISDKKDSFRYDYGLTDFTTIVSRKLDFNKTAAVGYLFRIDDDGVTHRSIQQFFITQELGSLKIAQRIATDQTFEKDQNVLFRLRYRIATELPLSGTAVDKNELYLKLNNEYIGAIDKTTTDLEIRLVPLIGYKFNDNQKLEWGFDYRINSFINNGDTAQRLFFNINFFQTL